MSLPDPTYLVCPTCGNGFFMQSRRLYTIPYEGGDKSRNWATSENSSSEIVCSKDGTRLKWNQISQSYDIVTS